MTSTLSPSFSQNYEKRRWGWNTRPNTLHSASGINLSLAFKFRFCAMRFRTLEIRWHDSKPISSCDFQPVSYKKARPGAGHEKTYTTQAYRLASGGEDNHVRVSAKHIAGVSGLNGLLVLDMDGPSAYKASKCCWRGCNYCAQATTSGVSRDS